MSLRRREVRDHDGAADQGLRVQLLDLQYHDVSRARSPFYKLQDRGMVERICTDATLKNSHHLFCGTCGIRSWSHGAGKDGAESVAINLRCLVGFEWSSLPVETFDGASL